MKLTFDSFDTPIGDMTAVFCADTLVHLDFSDCPRRVKRHLDGRFPGHEKTSKANPQQIRGRIGKYFNGHKDAFKDLKLDTGGTDFQQSVFCALQAIPHGKILSYAELARDINKPKAVRAVGSANGHNPIAIIIPCHRVIGSNGSLTGFGGGLDAKRHLLALEKDQIGLFAT